MKEAAFPLLYDHHGFRITRAGKGSQLPERLATTTEFFIDLIVARLLMRALFGESLKLLRAEIELTWLAALRSFLRPADTSTSTDPSGRWLLGLVGLYRARLSQQECAPDSSHLGDGRALG
jgi:hypothetical protein